MTERAALTMPSPAPSEPLLAIARGAAWAATALAVLGFFVFTLGLKAAFKPLLLDLGILMAVVVAGARFAGGRPGGLPAGPTWMAGTAAVGWALASTRWADHPLFSTFPAYRLLQALFLFLLLPQLLPRREGLGRLAGGYLLVSSLFGLGASLNRLRGPLAQQGFGFPTGNPNLTALVLEPGLLLSIALLLAAFGARRDRVGRVLGCGAALGVHAVSIGLTGSMGAALGLAVGLTVLGLALGGRRVRRAALLLGLLGVVALGAVLGQLGPEAARVGVAAPSGARGGAVRSIRLRWVLWQQAAALLTRDARTPWLGVGLGGYVASSAPYRPLAYLGQPAQSGATPHPHNQSLKIACEVGGVGLALVGLWLLLVVRRGLQLLRRSDPSLSRLAGVGLAALAALTVHGQVTVFLSNELGLYLLVGWAALLSAPIERPPLADSPRPLLGLAFALGPVVLLALALHQLRWRPLMGQLSARTAELTLRAGRRAGVDPIARRESFERAANHLARGLRLMTRPGESLETLSLRDSWAQASLFAGRRRQAINIWLGVRELCPRFGWVAWRLGSVHAMIDRPRIANRFYLEHLEHTPTEVLLYVEWWGHRERLADAATVRALIGHVERALGVLPPGPKREDLRTIKARLELLRETRFPGR